MAAEVKRKISAASARSHTRKSKSKSDSSSSFLSGFFIKFLLVFIIVFFAWDYKVACPPVPKKVGPPDGLPITTPRIKLRDGRHLSYKEYGVPKESAKYHIIFVHGFDSVKHDAPIATSASPDLIEELGMHIVAFDRPGYGESDPHPKRTLKSLALDTEELADQLQLGSKFYVIGLSMGGQIIWSFLKYIPHRLAGATLIAPVVNYWWPNLPANLSEQAYSKRFVQDQWRLRVVHHFPSLTYWWNTQKWFPFLTLVADSLGDLSTQDRELIPKFTHGRDAFEGQVRQQGEYESIHRDTIIGYGPWEFDPMDIQNPFPNDEGSVHIWQGDEDKLVSVTLQRYIAQQLPWVNYHELPGAGHMFPYADGLSDNMLKTLLLGKN